MSNRLISRIIDSGDIIISATERTDLIQLVADATKHAGSITVSDGPTEVTCEVKYITIQNFSTHFIRRYKKRDQEDSEQISKERYLEDVDKKMIELEYDGSIRTRVVDRIIKSWDDNCNKVELKFYSGNVEVVVTRITVVDGVENLYSLSHIVK